MRTSTVLGGLQAESTPAAPAVANAVETETAVPEPKASRFRTALLRLRLCRERFLTRIESRTDLEARPM
jgi:hypothetical protein